MKLLAMIAAGCLATTGALAQSSVPDVVKGYNTINVTYSEKVADCNLEHSASYEARLSDQLAAGSNSGRGIAENGCGIETVYDVAPSDCPIGEDRKDRGGTLHLPH